MLRQVVRPYVRATPSLQGAQLYLLAKVIIFHQFSTFLCLLFEGQQTRKQVQYFCYCSVLHNIIIEYIRLIENGNNIFCGILRIGIFHKIENAYVERQVFREVGA